MKSFIGIEERHSLDSSGYVLEILREHRPEAITLERQICLGLPSLKLDERKIVDILDQGIPFFQCTQEGYHYFNAEEILISMREDCPTTLAVQRYALEQRIPFYFVDWSELMPDTIFEFKDEMVSAKFLGKESYEKLLPKGQNLVHTGNINARNQLMGEAINYLFEIYNTIAHIGGRYHFNETLDLCEADQRALHGERLSPERELHRLVKAKVCLYDAVEKRKIK